MPDNRSVTASLQPLFVCREFIIPVSSAPPVSLFHPVIAFLGAVSPFSPNPRFAAYVVVHLVERLLRIHARMIVAPSRDSGIESIDEFVLRCRPHLVEEEFQTFHESFEGLRRRFNDEVTVSVFAEVPSQKIEAFGDVGDFRFRFRQPESANLQKGIDDSDGLPRCSLFLDDDNEIICIPDEVMLPAFQP